MGVGQRISERLAILGISQSELARRVGVSQPTISALINRNKVGSKHLHRIARELETTPEYLLEDTDDSSPTAEIELYPGERDILRLLRGLDAGDRAAVIRILEGLARR